MALPIRFVLGTKNLYLFIISMAVLLYGIYTYFDDFRFYFHKEPPVDLGTALEPNNEALAKLKDGDYVKIRGIRSLQGGVIEEGFSKKKHMLYFFLGSPKFLALEPMAEKEEENVGGVYVTVTGRAYNFKTNGAAAKNRDFFDKRYAITMAEEGWFIRGGKIPGSDTTAVVVFALLFILFIGNILLAIKTLRPKPEPEYYDPDDDGEDA
ncbi:MAG TPA: hypothetical protein PLV42_01880 [bacterium]|nr:hypothetical protein [bacterium]